MRDFVARRPAAAAALLYGLLALVIFAPGLWPGRTLSASDVLWTAVPWEAGRPADIAGLGSNLDLQDAAVQFLPALQAIRSALPHVPLWDPYTLGGRSLLGDPQSAVFSPFSVPSYLLPFWKSLAVVAGLKLFVAALGAFLLARLAGMRLGGALMTGLVFGFSLWTVTWVSWPHGGVWAFLPWLCLLCELTVRRPGPLPFAGLAGVVGLQFLSGHPASSYQVLFVVVLFWVGRVLASPELRRDAVARLLTVAAALVVGAAVAAVALIPFAELLRHSSDATARADASALLKQPSRYLLGIFLPDYWGHGRTALQLGGGLEERAYYVAALPLMLGAAALALRPSAARIAAVAMGAATLAVATGLPPFYDVVVHLPGFDAANNGRFAVIAVLCLALLAGWGLDELTDRELPARRRGLVLALAGLLLALPVVIALADREFGRHAFGDALKVAWGFAHTSPDFPAVIKLAAVLEWVGVAAAAVVLLVLRLRGRLGATAFVVLAIGLTALDLFKAGMGYNPAIPVDHAEQPTTGAIRYLQSQSPERFSALKVTKALSLIYPLTPNSAQRYRLQDVRGYVIPTEERYFDLWRDTIHQGEGCYYLFCTQAPPASQRAFQALALVGVGNLLQHPGDPPLPGRRPVYDGADARIYRNPRALPRAFLVDRQRVVAGADAARATATAPGFPARSVAVTERPIAGITAGSGSPGTASIEDYRAEHVAVDTDARRPALLVLTDNWYPGWKATVDGKSAPVERVDYLIRGVRVPAGAHRVEFSFEPASWRLAWIVSLLGLLTILGAAWIGWRRRPGETQPGDTITSYPENGE
jgi:Bacterial membrane protein YfhO